MRGLTSLNHRIQLTDILAGLTLAAIGIPEVMGYTKIIGTPVVTGLYTMLIPAFIFALLGSSRHLVVGADSATAAIVASALALIALPYSPEYLAMTSLIAFVAGLMLLVARMLRLGFLSNFLSQTVLVGFLTGVGAQVMLSQIPAMLNIDRSPVGGWAGVWHVLTHLSLTHGPSLIISASVLLVLVALTRWAPRFPAPLFALIAATVTGVVFNLEQSGVKMLGAVSGGLPHLQWPTLAGHSLPMILSVSFSCFIVILAQSAATASAYALRHQDSFNEDQDLLGLGAANLAAALSGTFVVNGSPTRTAIVESAGGRSQFSQITSAAVVLLVLLFFTKPLAYIPDAALSAIVFMIGVKLIDYRGLKNILAQSPMEFWLATLTGLTVVLIGVEEGIFLALVLSLLYHVRRSYKPNTTVLVQDAIKHWVPRALGTVGQHEIPGVLVYWFGADLFYANINHFVFEIHQLINAKPIHLLVIDAGAITGIDYSAAKFVATLRDELAAKKIKLVWAHVSDGLSSDMKRHQIFVEGTLFETLRECLATEQRDLE